MSIVTVVIAPKQPDIGITPPKYAMTFCYPQRNNLQVDSTKSTSEGGQGDGNNNCVQKADSIPSF